MFVLAISQQHKWPCELAYIMTLYATIKAVCFFFIYLLIIYLFILERAGS